MGNYHRLRHLGLGVKSILINFCHEKWGENTLENREKLDFSQPWGLLKVKDASQETETLHKGPPYGSLPSIETPRAGCEGPLVDLRHEKSWGKRVIQNREKLDFSQSWGLINVQDSSKETETLHKGLPMGHYHRLRHLGLGVKDLLVD